MKAFFIYRDGQPFGNLLGYTTEQGARNTLKGCIDWCELVPNGALNTPPTKEQEEFYKLVYGRGYKCWELQLPKWRKKVWDPYVKEHYKIVEREFEIVFKDEIVKNK